MNNQYNIRKMTENDIEFIIYANKQVREASNQTSEIKEFRNRIMKDVLSANPKANVIIIEKDKKLLGMALYSTVYFADEGEIMWLSNIFIEEQYRNKGIAKQLMTYLKQICVEKGYYAICGAVENSNNKSLNFFNSINSKWLNDFRIFVVK